jgi:hypothetical protein
MALSRWVSGLTRTATQGTRRRTLGRTVVAASAAILVNIFILSGDPVAAAGPGGVVGWGDDPFGNTNIPAGLDDVVQVEAGVWHSLALRADGTVVAWGDNSFGQRNLPAGLDDIVDLDGGRSHSVLLRSNGTPVIVGWDGVAPPTPGTATNLVAVSAGSEYTAGLRSDGTVVVWGDDEAGRTPPAGLSNVTAIAAGANHTDALLSNGTVVSWGPFDENDPPAGLTGVTAIAAGNNLNIALKSDGTVVTWGPSAGGAPPAGLTDVVDIAAGEFHFLALKSDGTVVAWGPSGVPEPPADLSGVMDLAAGLNHNLALVPSEADTTPPTTAITSAPAALTNSASASFEFSANESATFECNLDNAGYTSCSSPRVYVDMGDGEHTFLVRATDGAGNIGEPANHSWTVDATGPSVAITAPADGAVYAQGSTVAAEFSCTDSGSGIASCEGNVASGAAIDTSAPGSFEFAVTGTDIAGNSTTVTHSYQIAIVKDNAAPVNTVPGQQRSLLGLRPVTFAGNTAITVTDADAGEELVEVTLTATRGTLTLNPDADVTFAEGDGSADALVRFTGTIAEINHALNGMVYRPNVLPFVLASGGALTITTNDLGHTGAGGPMSDTDTVQITAL